MVGRTLPSRSLARLRLKNIERPVEAFLYGKVVMRRPPRQCWTHYTTGLR